MLSLKKYLGEVPMVYAKGGKGAVPEPAPLVQPTPPVEEASVEIEDSDEEKLSKIRTGKGSLKLPLADTKTTGLKV